MGFIVNAFYFPASALARSLPNRMAESRSSTYNNEFLSWRNH